MFRLNLNLLCLLAAAAAITACGGGGSGGGGGISSANASGPDIALASITFPESTDLGGATTTPPVNAPLSQQVVFTFTGPVAGGASSSSILIYAEPGLSFTGPEAAIDRTKDLIPARGTLEVSGNVVLFTPFIPKGEIDLGPNAQLDNVPGLLPGFTYTVFVPVETTGAIANLKGVDSTVKNPVEFMTLPEGLPSLFFQNHPPLPPGVVSAVPANGTVGVSLNTFKEEDLPEMRVAFDQPLDFSTDNLEGRDLDEDGYRDPNFFLGYTEPVLYVVKDRTVNQLGFLAGLNRKTNRIELTGFTTFDSVNVGLKSVVFAGHPFKMLGCDGANLYDVQYENPSSSPPIVELTNRRPLNLNVDAAGLVFTRDGELFGLDASANRLLCIDPDTGLVEVKGTLPSGLGHFKDLALGWDNELYGLRVFNGGSLSAVSAIERIDRKSLKTVSLISGLPADYSSLELSGSNIAVLFDASMRRWVEIAVDSGKPIEVGQPLEDPLLSQEGGLHFTVKRFELGVNPTLTENTLERSEVEIEPSGVLPFGSWVDLMVRNPLKNISGGSRAKNLGAHPLGAESAARFKTFDPGDAVLADRFLETFLDNEREELDHDFANARALWNVQDTDDLPPSYDHLLAGFGLSGAGELGDLKPNASVTTAIILDTDFQPLPLFDGSTPDIVKPVTVKGGEFHFRDIVIPQGVTVIGRGSNPLVLTATGSVRIDGTIDVSGLDGAKDVTFNSAFIPTPGGVGGPGGGRGGRGQPPIPEEFSSLTQLKSVPRGERGWGHSNLFQIGGEGGESGAKGEDVPWAGSAQDAGSRGAGGGGGSFLQFGFKGFPGRGKFGVDEEGKFFERENYAFWDGTYEENPAWIPGSSLDGQPKLNFWDPAQGDIFQNPKLGEPGERVFKDKDGNGELYTENDFIGPNGELKELQGGQGGGGGGSRLDSMNSETINQAAAAFPPLATSAFDSKGGGGGGGGGAIAIHSIGDIIIGPRGLIDARGGRGGGGEVIGMATFGGGGGGGSGGAIILNSGTRIEIQNDAVHFGRLDVSGGAGADAKFSVNVLFSEVDEPCEIKSNGALVNDQFCSYTWGDGGRGGHGLIQLMVPDPADPELLAFDPESVEATIYEIGFEPNFSKFNNKFSRYLFDVVGPPGNRIQVFPKTMDCLVPPEKTLSSISTISYGVSKWIDMGRLVDRPPLGGKKAPVFLDFEGVKMESGWALVNTTAAGFVINAHVPDFNDIEVDAPDLATKDFIPDTSEVAIQFQGTDAVVPGSKVPSEEVGVISPWTPDIATLNGRQFVRFRVRLTVAKDGEVNIDNPKPQVNFVRIRMKY